MRRSVVLSFWFDVILEHVRLRIIDRTEGVTYVREPRWIKNWSSFEWLLSANKELDKVIVDNVHVVSKCMFVEVNVKERLLINNSTIASNRSTRKQRRSIVRSNEGDDQRWCPRQDWYHRKVFIQARLDRMRGELRAVLLGVGPSRIAGNIREIWAGVFSTVWGLNPGISTASGYWLW